MDKRNPVTGFASMMGVDVRDLEFRVAGAAVLWVGVRWEGVWSVCSLLGGKRHVVVEPCEIEDV